MGNGTSRDQEDIFENEVNLFQFKLLRVIGRGSFGKVRMVERRETGKIYALKYISKSQVIKMDAVRNILREREILETLDHAFVVNMRFAFQDDEYMYMCMDLMMGGDLRFHLNRRQFNEDTVRFWIAELCSAVTHLHSLGIVHRDIKPDNVLLDEKGHAHLTDFNIGCKLTPQKPSLNSQSGTVAYMAPEVFTGSGYGTTVDWWAVGVLFYECIYNKRPFQTENIDSLKKAIPIATIEFPEKEGLSRECISAMRGFLTRDPKERLGVKGGMDGIRQHPFFQAGTYQTNPENWWYMLESKQLTPKFQPSSEQNNFDATYDLEELLLDDEPLTYRSTRKRALRMQKEKHKALKEENARLKAEQEAAIAAAELAMHAMRVSADDYYSNSPYNQQQKQQANSDRQKKPVKNSKLYRGEGKGSENDSNSSSTNSSYVHLSQPLAAPQPYMQSPTSPQARQHQQQFQSTPAFPLESSHGVASIPPMTQFPMPPPPTASRQSSQHIRNHSSMRQHPTSVLPPPPTQGLPMNPSQQQIHQSRHHASSSVSSHSSKPSIESQNSGIISISAAAAGSGAMHSGSTATGYTYSTTVPQRGHNSGVTAVYLSKPVVPGKGEQFQQCQYQQHRSKKSYCEEDDLSGKSLPNTSYRQMKQQQQQQNTSTSTSSSSSIGGNPLPHPLPMRNTLPPNSGQKFAVYQQQQQAPVQRQPSPNPSGATYPRPAANALSAPAAPNNLSRKEKFAYQMVLIDREFTTFDYTVYESYNGLIDPVTMSVGDPPEWVRSRD